MKKLSILTLLSTAAFYLSGCAYVADPPEVHEQDASIQEQRLAQQTATTAQAPTLKRKIAIGRISNETQYGKSLLRDNYGDPVGKQLTDMMSKALVQSGYFIVLERPDLGRLITENAFTGSDMQKVGADVLLMGSMTKFGRTTDGRSGFWTTTKRQLATATIDARLVDVESARVIFATSGSGQASTESGSVLGWGDNVSAYDGRLNDEAISTAVSEVVSNIISELKDQPWRTYFLTVSPNLIISGGKSQGIKVGDTFVVKNKGEQVKSKQTGFMIQLPGREIGRIKIVSQFGTNDVDEGSVCDLISGSLNGYSIDDLVIEEI